MKLPFLKEAKHSVQGIAKVRKMLQEMQQKIVVQDFAVFNEYIRQVNAENEAVFRQAKAQGNTRLMSICQEITAWADTASKSRSIKVAAEAQLIVEHIEELKV